MSHIVGVNCLTGIAESYEIENGCIQRISTPDTPPDDLPYVGPGLVDLQVNGIHGVDFNDLSLTAADLLTATRYLLSIGVTTFFPTLITNADNAILQLLKTIRQACEANPLIDACIGGIHLEGPFISKEDGARGAHPPQYVKASDWALVQRFQQAAGHRIKLITLAPEWEHTPDFIRRCRASGIRVAMGHTLATSEAIAAAVAAGATLSTHLGNAVPRLLPRHPNVLWEQLAQEKLYASIIADGFHLPDSFIKVVLKTKGERTLLVSDATRFSGMAPGVYTTHIGGEVVLYANGKLAMNDTSGLLAGAAKSLLENVRYLLGQKLAPLDTAWNMASVYPARFLEKEPLLSAGQPADLVLFTTNENTITITKVMKHGRWTGA